MTVVCPKCNRTLAEGMFYKRPGKPNWKPACRDCERIRHSTHRNNNRQKIRELAAAPHRVRVKKSYGQLWAKLNPEKVRTRQQKKNEKHPEKRIARTALSHAIRDKKITKPDICEVCESNDRIEAHHQDYSKPLEVTWLCFLCHAKIHRRYL